MDIMRLKTQYPGRNSILRSVSTQEEILADLIDKNQDENVKKMYYANMYKNMQKNNLCKVMNMDDEVVHLPETIRQRMGSFSSSCSKR